MTEFDPKAAEMIHTGTTAALVLDAVQVFAAECVESTLRRIDTLVLNGQMTPDIANQLVSEIAAYRRIVQRIKRKAELGTKVRDANGRTPPSAA